MRKLKIDGLMVEVTRRCNLACKHCCRGDSQNLDISDDVIDAILSNCESIEDLHITGGEPMLAVDRIAYVFNRIIDLKIPVGAVGLIINGTIYDEAFLDTLEHFMFVSKPQKVAFSVSPDMYHDQATADVTRQKYRAEIERRNLPIDTQPNPLYGEKNPTNGATYAFFIEGRVADLPKEEYPDRGVRHNGWLNHRVSMIGNNVKCQLYLSANGNIHLESMKSYEWHDHNALGNILQSDLFSILQKHNEECVYGCQELQLYEMTVNAPYIVGDTIKAADEPISPSEVATIFILCEVYKIIFLLTFEARKIIHKELPLIPMQEIIKATATAPVVFTYTNELLDILKESEKVTWDDQLKYFPQHLRSIVNDATLSETKEDNNILYDVCKILTLFNMPLAVVCPNRVYGSGSLKDTDCYKNLAYLNEKYKEGLLDYRNDEILACSLYTNPIDELKAQLIRNKTDKILDMIIAVDKINRSLGIVTQFKPELLTELHKKGYEI